MKFFDALLLLLLLLFGCKPNTKKLFIPFGTDIKKVCPHIITAQNWVSLSLQINETLFTINKYGEIRPLLIDDWEVNSIRDEYRFKLKKGIFFHNNKELLSEDVIYSFLKMKENHSLHTSSNFLGEILNIKPLGKYEFSIKLKSYLLFIVLVCYSLKKATYLIIKSCFAQPISAIILLR